MNEVRKCLLCWNVNWLEMVKVKYECWTWIEQTCDELWLICKMWIENLNDDWSGISVWGIVPDGEEKCEIVGLSRADSPTDCGI